jgi:hypothetical protein
MRKMWLYVVAGVLCGTAFAVAIRAVELTGSDMDRARMIVPGRI